MAIPKRARRARNILGKATLYAVAVGPNLYKVAASMTRSGRRRKVGTYAYVSHKPTEPEMRALVAESLSRGEVLDAGTSNGLLFAAALAP